MKTRLIHCAHVPASLAAYCFLLTVAKSLTATPVWEDIPLRSAASETAFNGPLQPLGLRGGEGGQAITGISRHTTQSGSTSFLMTTNTGGIYRALLEPNERIKWERCNVGIPGMGGYAVAIDPKNPASILVLYGNDAGQFVPTGIARTINRGAEWSRARSDTAFSPPLDGETTGSTFRRISEDRLGLVWDSRNGLAGDGSSTRAFYSSRVSGHYQSVNSGVSWSRITTATVDGVEGTPVTSILSKAHLLFDEDAGSNGRLYVASDSGFFYTDDPQAVTPTFVSRLPGRVGASPAIHGIDLMPDGTVYVTTRNRKIFANSRDGINVGLPWSEIVVGNGYTMPTNARVTYVSPNPAAPSNIVVNVALDYTNSGSYFFNQEQIRTHNAATAGNKVTLTGNAWKKFQLPAPYQVTADTKLKVTVEGSNVGELIGVVLDNDNDALSLQTDSTAGGRVGKRAFIFGGIDAPAVGAWSTVVSPAVIPTTNLPGSNPIPRTTYTIDVGTHFTGVVNHLGFIGDVDTAGRANVNVTFSNIKLYEDSAEPSVPLDFNGMTPEAGGAVFTSYTPGQDGSNGRTTSLAIGASTTPAWAKCTQDNSLNFAYNGGQEQRPVWFPVPNGSNPPVWKVLGEGAGFVTISPPLGSATPAGDSFGWCNDGYNGIMIGGHFSFSRSHPEVFSFGSQDFMGGVSPNVFSGLPATRWVGNLPYAPGAAYFAYHGYGGHAPTANLYVVGRADQWTSTRYLTVGTRANAGTGFNWTTLDTITLTGSDISTSDPGYNGANNKVIFASNWRCSGDPTLAASWSNMKDFPDPVSGVFTYDPVSFDLYGIHNFRDAGNLAKFNVLRSTDKGVTWTPLLENRTGWIQDLAYNHLGKKLWLIVQQTADNNQDVRLLTSTDNGTGFGILTNAGSVAGFPRETIHPGAEGTTQGIRPSTVAVDPVDPRIVYVGASRDYYRPDVHVIRSFEDGAANTWQVVNIRPGEGGISSSNPNGPEEVKSIRINPVSREVWISSAMYGFWKIAAAVASPPPLPLQTPAPYVLDDFDSIRQAPFVSAEAGTAVVRQDYDLNDADLEMKTSRTANAAFASFVKATFARNGAPLTALRDHASLTVRVIGKPAASSANFNLAWAVSSNAWASGTGTFRSFGTISVSATGTTDKIFKLDLAANPSIAAAAANYNSGTGTYFDIVIHNNGSPVFAGGLEFGLDDFTASTTPRTSPAQPAGFAATSVLTEPNHVLLAWNPLAVTTTGFLLERSTGGGAWGQIAVFIGTASGFTDTTCQPGTTYQYRLRTYALNYSEAVLSSVTTPTLHQAWRHIHFNQSAATGDAAPSADPDADGLTNLIEYAFDTNPREADADSPVSLSETFPPLEIAFTRIRSELEYTVQGSSDLGVWTTIITNPEPLGGTITISDPETTAPRFLRVVVTDPTSTP